MASPGQLDFNPEYQDYLARFEEHHGSTELGAFVKQRGRLVKKLRYDEFEPIYREFKDVSQFLDELKPILEGRNSSPATPGNG